MFAFNLFLFACNSLLAEFSCFSPSTIWLSAEVISDWISAFFAFKLSIATVAWYISASICVVSVIPDDIASCFCFCSTSKFTCVWAMFSSIREIPASASAFFSAKVSWLCVNSVCFSDSWVSAFFICVSAFLNWLFAFASCLWISFSEFCNFISELFNSVLALFIWVSASCNWLSTSAFLESYSACASSSFLFALSINPWYRACSLSAFISSTFSFTGLTVFKYSSLFVTYCLAFFTVAQISV